MAKTAKDLKMKPKQAVAATGLATLPTLTQEQLLRDRVATTEATIRRAFASARAAGQPKPDVRAHGAVLRRYKAQLAALGGRSAGGG